MIITIASVFNCLGKARVVAVQCETKNNPDFGCRGVDSDAEFLRCVFSSETEIKVGTGTTSKKHTSKLLWLVEQVNDQEYSIRKINPHFVPTGEPDIITFEDLMTSYRPEVEIHMAKVEPAMRHLHNTLEKGDEHRHKSEIDEAEEEYTKALEVDEDNVRAIFGLGLVYAERKDTKSAKFVFKQLVEMEAAFEEQHKHLFNEFGISLRKADMHDEAVEYYTRALGFSEENDDHLYYNVARAHYERGDWNGCFMNLSKALKVNGDLKEAVSLCEVIYALHEDEELLAKYGKPPVPAKIGDKVAKLVSSLNGEELSSNGHSVGDGASEGRNPATGLSQRIK